MMLMRSGMKAAVPRTKSVAEEPFILTFAGSSGAAGTAGAGTASALDGGAYGGGSSPCTSPPASISVGWLAGSGLAVLSPSPVVAGVGGLGVLGWSLTPGVM